MQIMGNNLDNCVVCLIKTRPPFLSLFLIKVHFRNNNKWRITIVQNTSTCRYDHSCWRHAGFRGSSEGMEDYSYSLRGISWPCSYWTPPGSYSSLRGSLLLLLQMRGALRCSKPALWQETRSLQKDHAQHCADRSRHHYIVSSFYWFFFLGKIVRLSKYNLERLLQF